MISIATKSMYMYMYVYIMYTHKPLSVMGIGWVLCAQTQFFASVMGDYTDHSASDTCRLVLHANMQTLFIV